MKENENKAIELNEEELAQVSGGGYVIGPFTDDGGTANDGSCGQTVDLDDMGKCTARYDYQCNGCKYKSCSSVSY